MLRGVRNYSNNHAKKVSITLELLRSQRKPPLFFFSLLLVRHDLFLQMKIRKNINPQKKKRIPKEIEKITFLFCPF